LLLFLRFFHCILKLFWQCVFPPSLPHLFSYYVMVNVHFHLVHVGYISVL
jgi:hypothetical protein